MTQRVTIGLPRMRAEVGERRDFLPDFVAMLIQAGADVVVEAGVGAGMRLDVDAYTQAAPGVIFGSHADAYAQDVVLVLRCPDDADLRLMRPDACLMSMLHYHTRPQRVAFLRQLDVEAISLDSLQNDRGQRVMQNFRAVAWNGVEAAFHVLLKNFPAPGLESPRRRPVRAILLGAGALGSVVVQAVVRYGDMDLWKRLAGAGVPGVQLTVVDFDVTRHEATMHGILAECDLLIDATQRPDPSRPVIPNAWVGLMPDHAVLLDLAVDPYNCDSNPPALKGIEGVVGGSLDQYIFAPDDPAFDALPACVDSTHRRWSVSCYSWPGVHPRPCMELYAEQLTPLMQALIRAGGPRGIDPQGPAEHRALSRAMLSRYV
ncbi:MAG: hypothetical protein KBG20_01720 [Caldilineaceae bacterium]|nr:hypothetical protein [Caldilineaceae bacterium]MBP8123372.1 hypothetical protein [Caldilineaceae bacterium]MBP9070980.1 hypothetical protein [Caldilineaceae bacterium]